MKLLIILLEFWASLRKSFDAPEHLPDCVEDLEEEAPCNIRTVRIPQWVRRVLVLLISVTGIAAVPIVRGVSKNLGPYSEPHASNKSKRPRCV